MTLDNVWDKYLEPDVDPEASKEYQLFFKYEHYTFVYPIDEVEFDKENKVIYFKSKKKERIEQ